MSGDQGERDWTLSVAPVGDGVQVELGLADLGGRPVTAILTLDRRDARLFARALLAAAGDAAERTFPRPPVEKR
ncbi:hypothetical protein [Methylobacterium iners]|uniref:Uncharacterized protein n=1 Tax=Methylobacterium iners TaxID=418707 RepID=A0ABQ4S186_9HYPH|nr:hypothetical protein [Methylobacterium iners]GJD96193.1 hypothetical protein OCOJLMKI_3412 [Methylobacterium iners]